MRPYPVCLSMYPVHSQHPSDFATFAQNRSARPINTGYHRCHPYTLHRPTIHASSSRSEQSGSGRGWTVGRLAIAATGTKDPAADPLRDVHAHGVTYRADPWTVRAFASERVVRTFLETRPAVGESL